MVIKVIAVGKLKENYWVNACDEYLKRLSKYAKVSVEEISEEKIPDESESYIQICKNAEGERILKKIKNDDYAILMAIQGQQMDSCQLATFLDRTITEGHSSIAIIIGGSYGVSEKIYERANYQLSFSKLTFPHQMARIMVLEQIYRCFKINHNERYHK